MIVYLTKVRHSLDNYFLSQTHVQGLLRFGEFFLYWFCLRIFCHGILRINYVLFFFVERMTEELVSAILRNYLRPYVST